MTQEKDQLIAKHIEVLGTRFLDATSAMYAISEAPQTFEEIKQVWDGYISNCVEENSRAVEEFIKKFNNKQILKRLINNELKLKDVCSKFNISEKKYLDHVADHS